MRPIDSGAVARDTVAVVRRHFAVFATLAAAFGFVPSVALSVVFPFAGQRPDLAHPVHLPPVYWLAALVAALIALVGMFTIASIAADPAEGGSRSLGAQIVAVLPRIGKAIVAGLLLFLVYLVGVIVFAIVVTLIIVVVAVVAGGTGGASALAKPDPMTTGAIAFGVIAVVLPVVLWLYARLTPLLGVLLREPVGPWAAIRRAWQLSRGSAGRLAALWLGLFVATIAVQVALWMIGPVAGVAGTAVILVRSAFFAWLAIYLYAGLGIVYRRLAEV